MEYCVGFRPGFAELCPERMSKVTRGLARVATVDWLTATVITRGRWCRPQKLFPKDRIRLEPCISAIGLSSVIPV